MPNRSDVAGRISAAVIFAAPFVTAVLAAPRTLRQPGLHQAVGAAVFAVIVAAGSLSFARGVRARPALAIAGALLMIPFTLIGLLWVGLATPWDATPAENRMRYLVLLAAAIAVTAGFTALRETLRAAGETLMSGLAQAASLVAGAVYAVWVGGQVEVWSARAATAAGSAAQPWNPPDTLLFVACLLTYLAMAGFAASCSRVGLIGPWPARVLVGLNLVAVLMLIIRGPAFPAPSDGSSPWWVRPGFIVGVPAIPWLMPHLLGAALARRAAAFPPPRGDQPAA